VNEPSTELGWIIEGLDARNLSDDDCLIVGTENHPEGADSSELQIETHPHDLDRVFVSWCTPDHGWDVLDEPKRLGAIVRRHVLNLGHQATLTWAIIETQR
jgi:hypothetical protein